MEARAVPQSLASDGVVTLPQYVVFKGDNDKYLATLWTEDHPYLQFNTTDIGSDSVRQQVVEVGDGSGSVMLKCLHWDKFWRRSPNWIWADTANADSSNKDTLFLPIKVDDERVALRCLGNNAFCKRLTQDGKTDCLNAGTSSWRILPSCAWRSPRCPGGSASITVSGEWGATNENQTTVTGTYDAPVEGGKTVEVTVTGTHAKCDVPFSYTQEDLLTTGETVVTTKDDGLFTGVNTTNVKFEVRYI